METNQADLDDFELIVPDISEFYQDQTTNLPDIEIMSRF